MLGRDAEGRVSGYQVFLPNGSSLIDLTQPFSDDWTSGFTGFHDDGIGYDQGYVYCLESGTYYRGLVLSSET